jgi:hypothetical protein
MSQKRTVTVLRCSRDREAWAKGVAHSSQNFAVSLFSWPHRRQISMCRVYDRPRAISTEGLVP